MKLIRYALLGIVVAPPLAARYSSVPVILVNGYQFGCAGESNARANFGNLAALANCGTPSSYIDNCRDPHASIGQLGADFGQALQKFGLGAVDVVAHGMGGLFVRSYLTTSISS